MNLFVDTSVWSLALRRDRPRDTLEVRRLRAALEGGELVVTTGHVIQELLQGFRGPKTPTAILDGFSALPCLMPEVRDHVEAAGLRTRCRRKGVQIGTIDALIAQLCINHELALLTTDRDFERIARHTPLLLAGA